jgi:hypothetical protein
MSRRLPGFLDRPVVTDRCIDIAVKPIVTPTVACVCPDCRPDFVLLDLVDDVPSGLCEADLPDGSVCLARLRKNGSCPLEREHR